MLTLLLKVLWISNNKSIDGISYKYIKESQQIKIELKNSKLKNWGLARTLLANQIKGVS